MTASWMRREALSAPQMVGRSLAHAQNSMSSLAARLRDRPPAFVATNARGSSDHAATLLKHLLETRVGIATVSLPPSSLTLHQAPLLLTQALFISLSQSGRSPDIVNSAIIARARGAHTLALVNDIASPLAGSAEVLVPIDVGEERSVAATKTCLAAMALCHQLASLWTDPDAEGWKRIPQVLAKASGAPPSGLVSFLASPTPTLIISRGAGLAVAGEVALKLKECCAKPAEALSSAELRHGPLALASRPLAALMLIGRGVEQPGLREVEQELRRIGVDVLTIGPGLDVPTPADEDPAIEAIAMLQALYLGIEAASRAFGRDPDSPPYLRKVTKTQ